MMLRIGDEGISKMFSNPLGSNLEELSLDLTNNKLQETAFDHFPHFISSLQRDKLTKLELILHGNKIKQNCTWDIARSLKQFTDLEAVTFDAYFNNLKAQGVRPIALLLKLMPRLKHLTLNLDLNYIET